MIEFPILGRIMYNCQKRFLKILELSCTYLIPFNPLLCDSFYFYFFQAHVDHINDVLEVQSKELERLHERALNEAIANEQAEFKREMAVIKGTLEALDRALDDKNFMKNASMDSQELWLACIALQQCVKSEENVPLEPKIQAIGKTISATYSPTYHSRAI